MKACKAKTAGGNIHSLETFGTHEGPGIRFVVFLQGCVGRCLYCQNPDTWKEGIGKAMTAQDIMARLDKCLPYIISSQGGITVSGGEPLLQIDFLRELFGLCRKKGIHTAVDTSAFYRPRDEEKLAALLALTDLFIVDVKALDELLHKRITSRDALQVLRFIALLEKNKLRYWIRYVLVPGLNDSKRQLGRLRELLGSLRYCVNFEFLPFHALGRYKWERMGLDYPLKDKRTATAGDIKRARQLVLPRPEDN